MKSSLDHKTTITKPNIRSSVYNLYRFPILTIQVPPYWNDSTPPPPLEVGCQRGLGSWSGEKRIAMLRTGMVHPQGLGRTGGGVGPARP